MTFIPPPVSPIRQMLIAARQQLQDYYQKRTLTDSKIKQMYYDFVIHRLEKHIDDLIRADSIPRNIRQR